MPTGGLAVDIVGGTVSTSVQTSAALNAVPDVTVTTAPTALPALAAGPGGIILQFDDANDPSAVMRFASNANATTGLTLRPGQNIAVRSIADASDLHVCLQAAVTGAALLHVMQG
jgi:hypothetical protein